MTNASNNGAKKAAPNAGTGNGAVAEAIDGKRVQTAANGGPGPAGSELVDGWDSLPPAVTRELAKPLDPSLVSQRRGRAGRDYSYIEGHTVIDQANRIFGFGGWGFDLAGEVVLREIESVDPKTGEVRRTRAYSAQVRVTVPGAPPRTDVGFHVVAEETGEGHETAFKGCVTDGLKRALRTFGDQMGNSLYGDQSANGYRAARESGVGTADLSADKAGSLAPSLRATLLHLGAMQGFDESQVRQVVKAKAGKELDELSASELTPLVEGATNKLRQVQETEAPEAA